MTDSIPVFTLKPVAFDSLVDKALDLLVFVVNVSGCILDGASKPFRLAEDYALYDCVAGSSGSPVVPASSVEPREIRSSLLFIFPDLGVIFWLEADSADHALVSASAHFSRHFIELRPLEGQSGLLIEHHVSLDPRVEINCYRWELTPGFDASSIIRYVIAGGGQ